MLILLFLLQSLFAQLHLQTIEWNFCLAGVLSSPTNQFQIQGTVDAKLLPVLRRVRGATVTAIDAAMVRIPPACFTMLTIPSNWFQLCTNHDTSMEADPDFT